MISKQYPNNGAPHRMTLQVNMVILGVEVDIASHLPPYEDKAA